MLTAANMQSALRQVMQGVPAAVRRLTLKNVDGTEVPMVGLAGSYGGSRMAAAVGMTNNEDMGLWCEAPANINRQTLYGRTGLVVDMAGTEPTALMMRVDFIKPTPEGGLWRIDLMNVERAAK